jgi:hypothetical protein
VADTREHTETLANTNMHDARARTHLSVRVAWEQDFEANVNRGGGAAGAAQRRVVVYRECSNK